jgi:Tfp pilus assembly protein PilV
LWSGPRTVIRDDDGSIEGTAGTAAAVPVRRARGQAGISLIESLIAVVLVSLVVLGLAGGFLTMMGATEASSSRQRREAALTSFTESLKQLSMVTPAQSPLLSYTDCDPAVTPSALASDYTTRYRSWPGRWQPSADNAVSNQTISDVEYWHPSGSGSSAGTYDHNCAGSDHGAQRLTVTVDVAGDQATGQVTIRRPS